MGSHAAMKYQHATTVLMLVLGAAILSSAALWNGYPLLFADSGTYLLTAINMAETGWLSVPWSRPPFYSMFLFPLHMNISLWPIVVGQALIIAHLLYMVMRETLSCLTVFRYLLMITLLAVCTSLPWFVGILTPDIFASVVVLGIYLLAVPGHSLSRFERLYVLVLVSFATASHFAHVPLAAGLALACVLAMAVVISRGGEQVVVPHTGAPPLRVSVWPVESTRGSFGVRRAGLLFAPAVLATIALLGANYAGRGEASVAPYSSLFLLARSIADGPAKTYLKEHCASQRYELCAYMGELEGDSNDFLWDKESPLYRIGVERARIEAEEIVRETVRAYPVWSLRVALGHVVDQLTEFHTGTWLVSYRNGSIENVVASRFGHEFSNYEASRQNMGTLRLDSISRIHVLVVAASSALTLLALLLLARIGATALLLLGAVIVVAVFANAAICGPLSIVTDRYQSRIVWLLVFFVLLAAFELRSRGIAGRPPIGFLRERENE